MSELPTATTPEAFKRQFVFKKENGAIAVTHPLVDLASEREPLRFAVTLEKVPTQINDGVEVESITIDRKSPKLQGLYQQAQALRSIPERERPRQLLGLLRSNVHFAYTDVLDEVAKTNPKLAQWVAENTGISSSSSRPQSLSEVVDKGYGVCRHLSVAMLALAKEAGMEGAYLTYGPTPDPQYLMENVLKDDSQPLFKMMSPGDKYYGGHAWVELKTSDGEWIPVDPSTQIVGDTLQGMELFRKANYRALVSQSLDIGGFPPGPVNDLGAQDLFFLPGEATHTGIVEVNSRPKYKPIVLRMNKEAEPEDNEKWPKPTQYKGPLNFNISTSTTNRGLNVGVVSVKVA